jgi:hypothetical protein
LDLGVPAGQGGSFAHANQSQAVMRRRSAWRRLEAAPVVGDDEPHLAVTEGD